MVECKRPRRDQPGANREKSPGSNRTKGTVAPEKKHTRRARALGARALRPKNVQAVTRTMSACGPF
ncbi:hypothetical protein GCM10009549_41380 [Streptomyces thermoalcalitolerans]|uniref:Uncharacterized protein n=1 Tax=Streptomyces thermoalcalitolerans TaxID=65605 RepID=A0ABP3ZKU0_9ACTN